MFFDCLVLNEDCIEVMVSGIEVIIVLEDLVGEIIVDWECLNGFCISCVCVLFGVIGIIYESCLNVIVDVGVLCLKLGNVVILCGGFESYYLLWVIYFCLWMGFEEVGLFVVSI